MAGLRIDAPELRIELHKRSVLKLERARGARLNAVQGCAWITVEREWRDFFVRAGEWFVVPSDRAVVVDALSATVTLELVRAAAV
ncbi:MAG: DUF2917 domain-containing protein [Betaproteobacteria bacterium]|nr:DUF2917 domain-containing protein [Betaproteobacteria bacterium]